MYQQLLFDPKSSTDFTPGDQGNTWFVIYTGGAGGGSFWPDNRKLVSGKYRYLWDKFNVMGGGSAGEVKESFLFLDPETAFGDKVKDSADMQFEFTVEVGTGLPGHSQERGSSSSILVELRHKITGKRKKFYNVDPSLRTPEFVNSFKVQAQGGMSTRYPWGANQNDNLAPWDANSDSGILGGFVDKTVTPKLIASGGAGATGKGYAGGPRSVNTKSGPGGRGLYLRALVDPDSGVNYFNSVRPIQFVDTAPSDAELEKLAEAGAFLGGGGYGGGELNPNYKDLSFRENPKTYNGGQEGASTRDENGDTDPPPNTTGYRSGCGGALGAPRLSNDRIGGDGTVWIWQPVDARPLQYDENAVGVYYLRVDVDDRIMLRGYRCTSSTRLILPTAV